MFKNRNKYVFSYANTLLFFSIINKVLFANNNEKNDVGLENETCRGTHALIRRVALDKLIYLYQ